MYEKIDRDEVLDAIKRYGPLQPIEVRRKIGKGESTMIGATLSELAYHKRVSITKVKRGSSPYYYDPGNIASLEKVAHALGEKDKRTFDLLQKKRVINPETVDPLTRVSLGNIPDFSKSFEHNGKQYYRYFLVSENEAKAKLQVADEGFEEAQEKKSPQQSNIEEKPIAEPEPKKPSSPTDSAPKESREKKQEPRPSPQKSNSAESTESQSRLQEPEDKFYDTIKAYCKEKKILIQNAEVIRKNSELDLVLRVPSSLGRITYFAKAKTKKKSNDGDVATALLGGQMRRLPALYLTTGEVTKKAKEMTKKELKGVIIKEI